MPNHQTRPPHFFCFLLTLLLAGFTLGDLAAQTRRTTSDGRRQAASSSRFKRTKKAKRKRFRNSAYWHVFARMRLKKRQINRSAGTARKKTAPVVAALAPVSPPALKTSALDYFNRAENLAAAEKYPAALADFQAALKVNPDFAEAHYQVGWISNELEDYETAVTALQRALELTVREPERAFSELGYAQTKLKRGDEALASYQQALLLKEDFAPAYFGIGDVHYEVTQRYAEAIEAYQKGLKLAPDNAAAYYRLGWCYSETRAYGEALEPLREALRLDPEFLAAQIDLGFAFYRLKQNTEAANALLQAVKLDPNSGLAYFYLGLNYAAMGRRAAAMDCYNKLKNLDAERASRLLTIIGGRG